MPPSRPDGIHSGEVISGKVEEIDSIEQLDSLIEKAATCSSIEDFEKGLEA